MAGREVAVSNPDKVFFPKAGHTKLDLVRYYLAVAEGALRGAGGRPMAMKRFVDGAEGEFFFQKRAPASKPEWIETVELSFPSGRTASEVVVREAAQLAWVINLGCIDLNPHPVRALDVDHPDELRVDLDPVPGVPWSQIREVAMVVRSVLEEHRLRGFPRIGSRIHINVRTSRADVLEVRAAALALAREVERRAPEIATSKWWKEERHGVFLDYNQNAKDRTVASAYSVRPTPDARVSAPLLWEEVPDCDPAEFTLLTMRDRIDQVGDLTAGMWRRKISLRRSSRSSAPRREGRALAAALREAGRGGAPGGPVAAAEELRWRSWRPPPITIMIRHAHHPANLASAEQGQRDLPHLS